MPKTQNKICGKRGPVSLSGLGGGVSWHTEKFNNPLIKIDNAPVVPPPPANAPKSLTGGIYIPDEDIGLGIKVMTTLELYGNARAFNGAAALEIIFKDDGGLKLIEFSGVAHFMAEPETNPSFILNTASIPEGIHAGLNLKYDFDHDIFTAQMLGYASVAGELEGCDGGCQSKKMGQIDMYFASDKWYINIGRTNAEGTDRIVLGINAHGFGYLSASAYLNIGTGIKPMPPLPAYAQKLVGNSVKINDESTRASGNGFAFGADIKFQFGTKQDAFIYGLVSVDLGFDVMMQDYGKAKCKNTGKQIGLNGWYASGQMYTQIKGDIGVKVKNKKFPILSVGVEAALQEKGPNPFWASGGLAVNYNLLFGLVKGSSQFKIEIGEQCELEADPTTNGSSSNVYSFEFEGYSSGTKAINGLTNFYNEAVLEIDQKCDSEYSSTTEKTDCKATKKDLPQVPQFNTPTPTSTTFNFNYYLPSGVLTSKVEKKVNH